MKEPTHRQLLDRSFCYRDTASMQLIDQQIAADYLRQKKLLHQNEEVSIQELPGGVSNVVLYVTRPTEPDYVVATKANL